MSKTSDDLSGPYESWATAPLDVASKKKKRVRRSVLAVLAIAFGIAGLNVAAIFFGNLHPLWDRTSTAALFLLLGVPLAGVLLLGASSKLKRWQRQTATIGLLLILPLVSIVFAPLLLYANQVGDVLEPVCFNYRISKKEVVKHSRGVSHDLRLVEERSGERVLRVSRFQFDAVHEGQTIWIQVGPGLFGMRHVKQISDAEIHGCAAPDSVIRRSP